MQGFAGNPAARYVGVFLATGGITANFPAVMAYQVRRNETTSMQTAIACLWLMDSSLKLQANNIRGQWKRAFSSASLVGLGSVGGIAGALIFRSQDAPHYRPGIWAALACNILIIVTVGILSIYFRICNKKVDRGVFVIEGLAGFKYTI